MRLTLKDSENMVYFSIVRLCRLVYFGFSGALLLFLILPILVIIPMSLNTGSFFVFPLEGISLRWYKDVFTDPAWRIAAGNSLVVGTAATVLATILGTCAAAGLSQSKSMLMKSVRILLIAPLAVPIVITAVAVFLFFSKFNLVGSYVGLILAHATLGLPFVIIAVTAVMEGFNRNLTRAAISLGASPVRAFTSVTLPIILPGVIAGAIFAFATSFDEIVVTLFLASPAQKTLPLQIFSGIRESISPSVTAVATILICISLLFLCTIELLRRRVEKLRGIVT